MYKIHTMDGCMDRWMYVIDLNLGNSCAAAWHRVRGQRLKHLGQCGCTGVWECWGANRGWAIPVEEVVNTFAVSRLPDWLSVFPLESCDVLHSCPHVLHTVWNFDLLLPPVVVFACLQRLPGVMLLIFSLSPDLKALVFFLRGLFRSLVIPWLVVHSGLVWCWFQRLMCSVMQLVMSIPCGSLSPFWVCYVRAALKCLSSLLCPLPHHPSHKRDILWG